MAQEDPLRNFSSFTKSLLSSYEEASEGTVITCPVCLGAHRLFAATVTRYDDDGNLLRSEERDPMYLFYSCKDASYLGAACGHLLDNVVLAPGDAHVT